jgi:hypothetical protein
MEMRGLLQNPKLTRAAVIVCLFVVLYLILNIFLIGGDQFVSAVNSVLPPVAALLSAYLFYRASKVKKDAPSRPAWLGMALGLGLWGFADVVWAFYGLVLKQEIPIPSIADIAWTIGYAPMIFALYVRYRMLKSTPTVNQRLVISAISLACLALTIIFVVRPILAAFEPQRAAESIFSILYSVGDVALVILFGHILVLLQKGRFAMSWRLIPTPHGRECISPTVAITPYRS